MFNMSPSDILKIHGKWIRADSFFSLVAEKNKITIRQAKRQVKKSVEAKTILRITLPNRIVLYGLEEFGSLSEEKNPQSKKKETINVLELQRDAEQAGDELQSWWYSQNFDPQ